MGVGSRRRRLWELPSAAHELVLGLSLTPDELRAATQRVLGRQHRASVRLDGSDAAVLSSAACDLATRNALSEALQGLLDRRHAAAVRRASLLKDTDGLRARWTPCLDPRADPADLPAALWALLTHPLGESQQDVVLAEARCWMHARVREQMATAQQQADLRQEHARLKDRWALAQAAAARARAADQQRRVADAAEMARLRGEIARLSACKPASEHGPAATDASIDAPAVGAAPVTATSTRTTASPQGQTKRRRQLTASGLGSRGGRIPPDPPDDGPASEAPSEARAALAIEGRNVLCVGGIQRAVRRYRSLIEARGGRFLHHDGGIEDSLQRLPSQLAAADVVLCQAGCLNHEAYRCVKAYCKRAGTPCVFLDRPSLSRMAGAVSEIGTA